MIELNFRAAVPADAAAVAALVQRAYRGESSRAGWTTEADLLDDQRVDAAGVTAKIEAADSVVLLAHDDAGELLACCEVVRKDPALAYFGMFAVEPTRQAGGLGRQVLAQAEAYARTHWAVAAMEMTVIDGRTELIDWYVRRGYRRSGATRPFPYDVITGGAALRDDLRFVVLTKALGTASAP